MAVRGSLGSYLDGFRLEIIKLVALIAITSVAFVATRTFANRTIAVGLEDAAEWHEIGQASLQAGDVAAAVDAFRRAANQDRENKTYGVALADALAMDSQSVQAERILLGLRENEPEDPGINLDLARLAATRGDVPTAVRYYQSALYAPPQDEDGPRQIRLELVRFLLQHDQQERALSELIAAVDDLGDETWRRVLVANLLLEAGDPSRALEQFEAALADEADNRDAAAGAGRAAYELGDYAVAVRHLRSAGDAAGLADIRVTAELVLERDPLAPRIRASERQRRLTENLVHVRMRLETCLPPVPAPPTPEVAELAQAIGEIERRIARTPGDPDLVDDGVALVHRTGRFLESRCGIVEPLDRALLLIGERHLDGEP
jgi:tetratricopeptide (TPR) repeat protein